MQLGYYRDLPNFGDVLSPLLARCVFGDIFDDDRSSRVLFIGTVIGRSAPQDAHEIIIGAGAGYKRGRYDTENRTVFCVRGPLTCKLLGIDRSHAGIDPAILASRHFTHSRAGGPAFMPHHHSHTTAGEILAGLCGALGITYISPLSDAEATLSRIAGASCLITEALHGAVVAESYDVPWVPVIFSSKVLEKKWRDFTATIGTDYRPVDISTNIAFDGDVRLANVLKHALGRARLGKPAYRYLPVRKTSQSALGALETSLAKLRTGPFVKSERPVRMQSIGKLDDAVMRFTDLNRCGAFNTPRS
ncbi:MULTISPECIES: polysaccharide pyruvyl transferase family protein [Phyllobacteriaceae]|jgi:succinoglycan biosynthesis protein ExoV|uniref:Polysaccharide pyruvyl transferase domain-containing protein n=1 Tax=Mesorhizobium hungaricum TaxID=1566387 RepID=A0A1C2DCC7_9HYPH|nr:MULTISPECIES: polysaccharide pyruvyl transferase family protein [Mesorhizobium]MBN9236822.1 polysaccharide pyruvyl transferase family protein [Mesorhizobium sp.]MDQ0331070.1 succinoglycan biosynthesis protein ExoV [Mesorhizobium sp. YL-MeA3-2017]OCX12418.1 hypothetical protein QV13_22555 [Mesorhizobium hungaricum]